MAIWAQNLGVSLGTRWQAMDSAVAEVLAVAAGAEVVVVAVGAEVLAAVEAEVEVLMVGLEVVRGKGPTFPAAGPRPYAGRVVSPSSLLVSVPVSATQVEKVLMAWAEIYVWHARDVKLTATGTVKKMQGMEATYRQRWMAHAREREVENWGENASVAQEKKGKHNSKWAPGQPETTIVSHWLRCFCTTPSKTPSPASHSLAPSQGRLGLNTLEESILMGNQRAKKRQ